MNSVLRAWDSSGKRIDIPAIRGRDGVTPVRGEDYWTVEDQKAMASDTAKNVAAPAILNDIRVTEDADVGYYDSLEGAYFFEAQIDLVIGNTYAVTIDGVTHRVKAVEDTDNWYTENGVALYLDDITVYFQKGGTTLDPEYNAVIYPDKFLTEDTTASSGYCLTPFTVSIRTVAAPLLPYIAVVATRDDGSTATYHLYGEELPV